MPSNHQPQLPTSKHDVTFLPCHGHPGQSSIQPITPSEHRLHHAQLCSLPKISFVYPIRQHTVHIGSSNGSIKARRLQRYTDLKLATATVLNHFMQHQSNGPMTYHSSRHQGIDQDTLYSTPAPPIRPSWQPFPRHSATVQPAAYTWHPPTQQNI